MLMVVVGSAPMAEQGTIAFAPSTQKRRRAIGDLACWNMIRDYGTFCVLCLNRLVIISMTMSSMSAPLIK